jgi:hypothetical protein
MINKGMHLSHRDMRAQEWKQGLIYFPAEFRESFRKVNIVKHALDKPLFNLTHSQIEAGSIRGNISYGSYVHGGENLYLF